MSPEGTPQKSAVQYIQVLRPLMMAQPYLQNRPLPIPSDISMEAKPIQKATIQPAYTKSSPLIGAHSVPLTAYSRAQSPPPREMSLNMYEYMPAASSRVSTTVLSPWMNQLMPSNYFQMRHREMAQRA